MVFPATLDRCEFPAEKAAAAHCDNAALRLSDARTANQDKEKEKIPSRRRGFPFMVIREMSRARRRPFRVDEVGGGNNRRKKRFFAS